MNLPAGEVLEHIVAVADYARTFDTNNLTIAEMVLKKLVVLQEI